MAKQVCPRCSSKEIVIAEGFSKLGDPILTQGLVGWKCLNCWYIGKDFFMYSKTKSKK